MKIFALLSAFCCNALQREKHHLENSLKMCINNRGLTARVRTPNETRLLLTLASYECTDEKGEKGPIAPSKKSSLITIAFLCLLLVLNEQFARYMITKHLSDIHEILSHEINRFILARHIAVDAVAAGAVSYLGIIHRHKLSHLITVQNLSDPKAAKSRIHTYEPAGHQVLLYFCAYQAKNFYDTFYWNDGIIFVLHHLLAGTTAWFGMYPGMASIYGIFFMGISEFSTFWLVLLANFDNDLGVSGLDEIFPTTKIVLGVIFVVTFVICRVILWPILAYHFLNDSKRVLALAETEKATSTFKYTLYFRTALKIMVWSCVGLSALQILFLGEIIATSKAEISALL